MAHRLEELAQVFSVHQQDLISDIPIEQDLLALILRHGTHGRQRDLEPRHHDNTVARLTRMPEEGRVRLHHLGNLLESFGELFTRFR